MRDIGSNGINVVTHLHSYTHRQVYPHTHTRKLESMPLGRYYTRRDDDDDDHHRTDG